MLKPEMEKQLKIAHLQIGDLIKAFRDEHGRCCGCEATVGVQHSAQCPLWPLILWRQANHDQGLFGQVMADMSTPHPLAK